MRMRNIRNTKNILSGHKITSQRRVIIETFCESGGNIDARELFRRVNARDASISLATVYRTLKLLKETGCIEDIRLGNSRCWYEIEEGEEKACLICRGCGRMTTFQSQNLQNLLEEIRQKHGFQVKNVRMYLEGCCDDCEKKQRGNEN